MKIIEHPRKEQMAEKTFTLRKGKILENRVNFKKHEFLVVDLLTDEEVVVKMSGSGVMHHFHLKPGEEVYFVWNPNGEHAHLISESYFRQRTNLPVPAHILAERSMLDRQIQERTENE